jgi:hypothetical protein
MATPRWEGDEVGAGVGDAGELAPPVRQLLDEMVMPDWVTEDPQRHLLPHLQDALAANAAPFQLLEDLVVSAVYNVTVAWQRSDGTIGDLRHDVFRLLGAVAESTTLVRQHVVADRIEFDVVTGTLEGESSFRTHGHMLRLKVVGNAAARLAGDAQRALATE